MFLSAKRSILSAGQLHASHQTGQGRAGQGRARLYLSLSSVLRNAINPAGQAGREVCMYI